MLVLVGKSGKVVSKHETFEDAQKELIERQKEARKNHKICDLEIVETDDIEGLEDELTYY